MVAKSKHNNRINTTTKPPQQQSSAGKSSNNNGNFMAKMKLSKSLSGMKFMKRRLTDEQVQQEREEEERQRKFKNPTNEFFVFDHGFEESEL